jgi:hypothetical protein
MEFALALGFAYWGDGRRATGRWRQRRSELRLYDRLGDYLAGASFLASWRNAAIVAAEWSLRFLFLGRRFLLVV